MMGEEKVKEKYIVFSLLLFAFITSYFGTMSSPFYPMNYWVDPNAYFTMAKSWLNGYIPYKDLFDHKGPVLYIIYALGCMISNTSFTGIYIIQSIGLFITLFYIYKTSRLFLSSYYGFIATLFSGSLFFSCNMYGGSAEEFIIPLQSISLFFFLKHFINKENPENIRYSLLHGIIIGITALIKYNLLIFWFFPLAAIFIQYIIDKSYWHASKYVIYTTSGILIVCVPVLFYFHIVGALSNLIFSYITFNSMYASLELNYPKLKYAYRIIIRLYPILIILIFLGCIFTCFCCSQIKKITFKVAFTLSTGFSLLFMGTGFITEYHILSLYIVGVLGIIFLFKIIENKHVLSFIPVNIYSYGLSLLIIFIFCLYIKRGIITTGRNSNQIKEFTKIILNSEDCTFLSIGLDKGFYLTTHSYPLLKYYYNPNIPYSKYPQVIDSQKEYIKEKTPMFLIIDHGDYGSYYIFFAEYIKNDYSLLTKNNYILLFKRNTDR